MFSILYYAANETYAWPFQDKLLNNILFTNTKLFKGKLIESEKCSFCAIYKEDLYHLFYDCSYTRIFWNRFCNGWSNFWSENLSLSLKDVIVGILNRNDLLNYLIILGKLSIWECRRNKTIPKFDLFLHKVEAKNESEGSLPWEIRSFMMLDGNHYSNNFCCGITWRKYVDGSFKISTVYF